MHNLLTVPLFNRAWWQRSWDQRPIGAQDMSPAKNTIIIPTTAHHPANDKNRIRLIQMSSRRHQLLQNAVINHRIPEKSRLHTWMRQFTAESQWAQRPTGAPGTSATLKTIGTSSRPFLHVNWARSSTQAPTMDKVLLPQNAVISKTKGKVRDDSRVSTVMTTIFLFQQSAPIAVRVYSYRSSSLEEAHWQRHFEATQEYITRATNTDRGEFVNDLSTLTAMTVCTSEVHLRRRHPTTELHWGSILFPWLKRAYTGERLRSVKCIYGKAVPYDADRLHWLPWLWWPRRVQVICTIEVHLHYEWFSTAITVTTKAAINKSSANHP